VRKRRQPPQHWDLAYVNTIVGTYALPMIDLSTPVLVHVHELLDQPSIAEWLDRNARFIADLERRQPQFLAVGERVKDGLVRRLGVAPSAVEVCYEFIPTDAIHVEPAAAAAARAELDLPDGAFIVGGSGTMDWRKGIDLFVQVASRMRARGIDDDAVRFVWVGGDDNPHSQIRYDIARMGLGAMVQVVPTTSDPRPYFANFDVFALTSRIDPFPLVCLEAAALAKPIVCFDSGGMPEFVEADCGYVVPYGDVEGMTERLDQLRRDLAMRELMGTNAAAKVRARHDLDVAAPGILDSIRRAMS
jgi:glycosyltransferase involved in cell wall biosynthesis